MKETNSTNVIISNRLEKIYTKKDFISLVKKVIFILIFAFVVFTFIFGFYPVKGDDMVPNIKDNDLALIYRLDKRYLQNDVVLIEKNGQKYMLRIIGRPGDTIDFNKNGNVTLNGEIYEEETIYTQTYGTNSVDLPVTLNEGEYFVLGDMRINAVDSRNFGVINANEIKGKVIYIFRNRNI